MQNESVPMMIVTVAETTPDGATLAYSYQIPHAIGDVLMHTILPAPYRVCRLSPEVTDKIRSETDELLRGPGIENWQTSPDHMPEAMWPDERWL